MNETLFTVESIRGLVESRIEKAEPQTAILAYLRERNGKTLTKRDLPKLKLIDGTIDFRTVAGMFYIEWGGYSRTNGNAGGSMLIAHHTGAPTIDADMIEHRHNPGLFAAREERNAQRAKALADVETLQRVADALNAKMAAERVLAEAFAYGAPLSPDEYHIREVWKMKAEILGGMWPPSQR